MAQLRAHATNNLPHQRTWTEEQITILREKGGTMIARDLAEITGHSVGSTQHKMHQLGIKGARAGGRYIKPGQESRGTPEEQERIRELAGQGLTAGRIGQLMNRDARTVIVWADRNGIELKRHRRWTPEQDEVLRANAHLGTRACAAAIGRSEEGTAKRAEVLGVSFVRQKRSKAPQPIRQQRARPARKPATKVSAPPRKVIHEVSRIKYCPQCKAPVSNQDQHLERMPQCRPQTVTMPRLWAVA